MSVTWTTPELATRYAPYVEELHEFLTSYGVHYGSARDVLPVVALLDDAGPFAHDLSSMIRSIVLREGRIVPRADLIEIVAVAIGGTNIDQAPAELEQPIRQLLGFVNSSLRRPWNEPDGRPAYREKVVEFPGSLPASFVRPDSVYSRHVVSAHEGAAEPIDDLILDGGPEQEFAAREDPEAAAAPAKPPDPHQTPPSADAAATNLRRTWAPRPGTHTPLDENLRPHHVAAGLPPAEPAPARPSLFARPLNLRNPILLAPAAVLATIVFLILLHPHTGTRAGASPADSQTVLTPYTAAVPTRAPLPGAQSSAEIPAPAPTALPVAETKPSPYGSVLNQRPQRRLADSEIIADPYTTPIPGQTSAATTPAPPATQQPGNQNPLAASNNGPAQPGAQSAAAQTSDISAENHPPAPIVRVNHGAHFTSGTAGGTHIATVSYGMMAHNIISAPLPDYPTLARITHTQGQVILQAVIARDGTVSATHVLSGHRLLRGAAVDAVRRWRFRPYVADGRAIDVATIITVDFRNQH